MTIGERIRMERKIKKLTQGQLADLSGVAVGTIRQYEVGRRQPRIEQLNMIATALDVPITSLIDINAIIEEELGTVIPAVSKVVSDMAFNLETIDANDVISARYQICSAFTFFVMALRNVTPPLEEQSNIIAEVTTFLDFLIHKYNLKEGVPNA